MVREYQKREVRVGREMLTVAAELKEEEEKEEDESSG